MLFSNGRTKRLFTRPFVVWACCLALIANSLCPTVTVFARDNQLRSSAGKLFIEKSSPATPAAAALPAPVNANSATKDRVNAAINKLPLSFEANDGQSNGRVKFTSRGQGYHLFLTSTEAVPALSKPSTPNGQIKPLGNARHTYKDFDRRLIWIYVPSLSPFVILKGASDQISDLIKLVRAFNLKQGIVSSLDAKLQNAQDALTAANRGDKATACNLIGSFINEVQAQTGKAITVDQANRLIAAAKQIRVVLGCR